MIRLLPVGEPAHPIYTGVHAHNASLGPSSGAKIGALDHDWKIAGVISSVNLFTEIPDTITSSFFSGTPNVTLKDHMFEKSSPIRHATELYHQVCKMNDCETELFKEILLVVTDGGGDHNVSHASVQVALIYIFLDKCCGTSYVYIEHSVAALCNRA